MYIYFVCSYCSIFLINIEYKTRRILPLFFANLQNENFHDCTWREKNTRKYIAFLFTNGGWSVLSHQIDILLQYRLAHIEILYSLCPWKFCCIGSGLTLGYRTDERFISYALLTRIHHCIEWTCLYFWH